MFILDDVDWHYVKDHYFYREKIHQQLLILHNNRNINEFAELALGISDAAGNYSAYEHGLGPQVLDGNLKAHQRVFKLAANFIELPKAHDVPRLIEESGIRYLQIGVGSEASCMVNPTVCWVANTQTIWAHLVDKHGGDFGRADEELRLYRNGDQNAKMAYRQWADIHRELGNSMAKIAEEGAKRAKCGSIEPRKLTYLWADAIANWLYENRRQ